MHRILVLTLRIVIALVVACSLVGQLVLVPELACEASEDGAGLEPLVAVLAVAAIAVIVCVQVALTCTWVLLGMVARRSIFTERSTRWVDGVVASAMLATAILLAVLAIVLATIGTEGPGLLLMLLCLASGGVVVSLLMLVMRGLLTTATSLRSELDEVV